MLQASLQALILILAGDEIIVRNFTIIKAMIIFQICLTDSKEMWMMISNDVFNLIYFILQISIASIPVTQLNPPIGPISIKYTWYRNCCPSELYV